MKLNRENHNVTMPISDYEAILNSNFDKKIYDDAVGLILQYFAKRPEMSDSMALAMGVSRSTPSFEGLPNWLKENNINIQFQMIDDKFIIKSLKYINA